MVFSIFTELYNSYYNKFWNIFIASKEKNSCQLDITP